MHAEGTQPTLESILAEEVRCTDRLLSCMAEERTALVARNMHALQSSIEDKVKHTQQLESLEQQREAAMKALGFQADKVQQCIEAQPRTERLQALWTQVLENTAACRDANLSNGGILESGRQHVELALGILRGQSGAPALYNTAGNTAADLGQRDLGKV